MPTTSRSRHKWITALAIAAFGLCYAGVAGALVNEWSTNYVYSYGFAVPLISGYMVWARWPRIQSIAWTPDYLWSAPVALAGLCALVVGRAGALLTLQEASLVITLSGLVLLFLGRGVFRTLGFPIVYLFLGIPLWDYPISLFQEPSQALSARIALDMLHPIGIPALREGTTLVLPTVTLEVLRECSGVNQLVAIVAMTLPASFLWLESHTRRVALIAMAVVTAYVSNGLRIALIGVLAYNNVSGAHDRGVLHLLQGLAVSALGYLLIGACLSVLAKTERRRPATGTPAVESHSPDRRRRRGARSVESAVVGAMLAAGGFVVLFQPMDVPLTRDLRTIPMVIGNWTADPTASPTQFSFTGVEDQLARVYRNNLGSRIELYVGYHHYQTEGKEFGAALHQTLNREASPLDLSANDGRVNQSGTGREKAPARALFWYDVNGRLLGNAYEARAYTVWDAITTRRTNAAVVVVAWDGDGGRTGVAATDAIGFARALTPLLRQYLPAGNGQQSVRLSAADLVSP
jgi:EpsI family protein